MVDLEISKLDSYRLSYTISTPGGGGFARDRTKPAEFLAPLTA